jgi:phosphoglycolate phosphatase
MNYSAALLLDLDGTLVDTANDFIHILQSMCLEDGLTAPDATTIRNTVSDGARALITLCYGLKENEQDFEDKRQQLLNRYEQELGQNAALFTGFDDVIQYCEKNNIAWGIVTNKPWLYTELLLQRLQINPSNNVIICPDHVSQTKPNAEPLLLAAKKLKLKPEQCLYAGDHLRDIQAGINANMQTIACNYGYIKSADNSADWQADYSIEQPIELIALLQDFLKQSA